MVTMTPKAAEKVKDAVSQNNLPENTLLRVDVEKSEGEQQLRLTLRLDPQEPRQEDEVQTTEGARVAVHKDLAQAIGQAQIDFRDDAGFVLERTEPTQ